MDVIYKIFSNIIKERLDKWTNHFDIIDEAQAGFRSGYSVVDNMFSLQAMIQKYISRPQGRSDQV
jgi:hypothetical protein